MSCLGEGLGLRSPVPAIRVVRLVWLKARQKEEQNTSTCGLESWDRPGSCWLTGPLPPHRIGRGPCVLPVSTLVYLMWPHVASGPDKQTLTITREGPDRFMVESSHLENGAHEAEAHTQKQSLR